MCYVYKGGRKNVYNDFVPAHLSSQFLDRRPCFPRQRRKEGRKVIKKGWTYQWIWNNRYNGQVPPIEPNIGSVDTTGGMANCETLSQFQRKVRLLEICATESVANDFGVRSWSVDHHYLDQKGVLYRGKSRMNRFDVLWFLEIGVICKPIWSVKRVQETLYWIAKDFQRTSIFTTFRLTCFAHRAFRTTKTIMKCALSTSNSSSSFWSVNLVYNFGQDLDFWSLR